MKRGLFSWEKKAIAINFFLAILLGAAVLRAGAWVDLAFYQDGLIKETAIKNYRSAIGTACAISEINLNKHHRHRRIKR